MHHESQERQWDPEDSRALGWGVGVGGVGCVLNGSTSFAFTQSCNSVLVFIHLPVASWY